jgi:hypothetical protein
MIKMKYFLWYDNRVAYKKEIDGIKINKKIKK